MAHDLELIKSANGSLVTALDLTNCFSADYDVYYLTCSLNLDGGAGYSEAFLLDSGGSTVPAGYYDLASLEMYSNTAFVEYRLSSNVFFRGYGGYQDDGEGFGFSAFIYSPFDTGSYTYLIGQSGSSAGANTTLAGSKTVMVYKNTTSIYGIRLSNSTPSTYDYIEASIYGVK